VKCEPPQDLANLGPPALTSSMSSHVGGASLGQNDVTVTAVPCEVRVVCFLRGMRCVTCCPPVRGLSSGLPATNPLHALPCPMPRPTWALNAVQRGSAPIKHAATAQHPGHACPVVPPPSARAGAPMLMNMRKRAQQQQSACRPHGAAVVVADAEADDAAEADDVNHAPVLLAVRPAGAVRAGLDERVGPLTVNVAVDVVTGEEPRLRLVAQQRRPTLHALARAAECESERTCWGRTACCAALSLWNAESSACSWKHSKRAFIAMCQAILAFMAKRSVAGLAGTWDPEARMFLQASTFELHQKAQHNSWIFRSALVASLSRLANA
jgi:hypothetical protein